MEHPEFEKTVGLAAKNVKSGKWVLASSSHPAVLKFRPFMQPPNRSE